MKHIELITRLVQGKAKVRDNGDKLTITLNEPKDDFTDVVISDVEKDSLGNDIQIVGYMANHSARKLVKKFTKNISKTELEHFLKKI